MSNSIFFKNVCVHISNLWTLKPYTDNRWVYFRTVYVYTIYHNNHKRKRVECNFPTICAVERR